MKKILLSLILVLSFMFMSKVGAAQNYSQPPVTGKTEVTIDDVNMAIEHGAVLRNVTPQVYKVWVLVNSEGGLDRYFPQYYPYIDFACFEYQGLMFIVLYCNGGLYQEHFLAFGCIVMRPTGEILKGEDGSRMFDLNIFGFEEYLR